MPAAGLSAPSQSAIRTTFSIPSPKSFTFTYKGDIPSPRSFRALNSGENKISVYLSSTQLLISSFATLTLAPLFVTRLRYSSAFNLENSELIKALSAGIKKTLSSIFEVQHFSNPFDLFRASATHNSNVFQLEVPSIYEVGTLMPGYCPIRITHLLSSTVINQ